MSTDILVDVEVATPQLSKEKQPESSDNGLVGNGSAKSDAKLKNTTLVPEDTSASTSAVRQGKIRDY